MRITQGTFSFLPDFTDEEITAQINYALDNGWPLSVEFTDDPHPRNVYWEMWGLPMFDLKDAAGVLMDTFLLRSLLVPSLVVLLGRWNWWPSHLARDSSGDRAEGASAEADAAPG